MIGTCHYTFLSRSIECTTPRVSANVKYRLWVLLMCQCRFINYNKCIPLVGVLIMRKTIHVWRQGVYGKSLYLPLQNCSKNSLNNNKKVCYQLEYNICKSHV